MTRPAISLDRVAKTYPKQLRPADILRHMLGRTTGRTVFENISFDIPKGQVVGLIGPNGAGKSTLLRLIAGQADPSAGQITLDGHLLAILQIATGLQDEWTGRDNIRLLGRLYGMSDARIRQDMEKIIAFAQLERFIDFPVRTYSAGMRARLAFSLVTNADCDILLIDEALSVGDAGFAQRCRQRMRELCNSGFTAIIVSHSMNSLRELCDRVIWLENGQIVADGRPDVVTERYRLSMLTRAEQDIARRFAHRNRNRLADSRLTLTDLWVENQDNRRTTVLPLEHPFRIRLALTATGAIPDIRTRVRLVRVDGVVALDTISPFNTLSAGAQTVDIGFDVMRLGRYAYECQVALLDSKGDILGERATVLAVDDDRHSYNSGYYQPILWQASSRHPDKT